MAQTQNADNMETQEIVGTWKRLTFLVSDKRQSELTGLRDHFGLVILGMQTLTTDQIRRARKACEESY